MARKVNLKTIQLIEEFEGYEKQLANGSCIAYLDTLPSPHLWSPGYHGLWTIGWGSTGPDITEGTIWTRTYAEKRLWAEVNKKAAEVAAYLTYTINDNQFGALVSLAYNIGTGGIHDILDLVNSGDLEGAANAFPNYNHAGGVVVAGLTRRRLAEQELFEWEVPAEVAQMSPVMKLAQYGKRATAGVTLTTAGMFGFVQNAQQVVTNNAGWILLGIAGTAFLVFHLFQATEQTAFDNGTSVPEGTKPVRDPAPELAGAPIMSTRAVMAANNNTPVAPAVVATPVAEAA